MHRRLLFGLLFGSVMSFLVFGCGANGIGFKVELYIDRDGIDTIMVHIPLDTTRNSTQ